MVVTERRPVADGVVGEKRVETLAHRAQEGFASAQVQESLSRAREGGFRQIFGSRRRTHGEFWLAPQPFAHTLVSCEKRLTQLFGQRRLQHGGARRVTANLQFIRVLRVEVGEKTAQLVFEIVSEEQAVVSVGGRRKAVEDAHSLRSERVVELTERGVFAADARNIPQSYLRKIERVIYLLDRQTPTPRVFGSLYVRSASGETVRTLTLQPLYRRDER